MLVHLALKLPMTSVLPPPLGMVPWGGLVLLLLLCVAWEVADGGSGCRDLSLLEYDLSS